MEIVVKEPIVAIRKEDGELTMIWFNDSVWWEFMYEVDAPEYGAGAVWSEEDLDIRDYDLLGNL